MKLKKSLIITIIALQLTATALIAAPPIGETIPLYATINDRYLAINPGDSILYADQTSIIPSGEFLVEDAGSGYIKLKASNGNYVRANPTNKDLPCDATVTTGDEILWEWVDIDTTKVRFRSYVYSTNYMRVDIDEPDDHVDSTGGIGSWTEFKWTDTPQPETMRKGPYLLYPGVNTQMTVLWQLAGTVSCTLEWGTDTTYSDGNTQTTEYGSDHQHKHTITNLTPGTKYYYRVTVGQDQYTGSFTAAPSDSATSVKFLAYGDTRSYPATHDTVCAGMIDAYVTDPAYQTLSLHVGDWINSDTESDWTSQFFGRSRLNTLQFQSEVAINGCRGNHEGTGNVYAKYWPYPYVNSFYWSFDYGPVHVAVVDQYVNYGPSSAQYSWLEDDLANSTKTWKFILLHEPGYSAGGHDDNTNVQNYIQPLCEQYGVQMVIAGHNHYYARCDRNGVKHITTGGGGAPLYAPNPNYSQYVEATAQVNHFCQIDIIDNTELDFYAVEPDGTVFDSFTLSYGPETPPFYDGFESGGFTTGKWATSGGATVTTQAAYAGTYGAQAKKVAWIQKAISTEGFTDIHVKYARTTAGLDSGEFLTVEWSTDGSTWYPLETTQDTSWGYANKACGSGADNDPGFRVRFALNADKTNESAYIDEVEIVSGGGCTATDCHVESIDCSTIAGSQGNKYGQATVTIYDDCGAPVQYADVDGTFTGSFNETIYDVTTDENGQAVFTTSTQTKKPSFTFCVDDVTHATLPYDQTDNVETCDSY